MKQMKLKITAGLFLLLIALFAVAQVSTQPVGGTMYTISGGNTLWQVSADVLHDPLKWGKILESNPFLADRVSERNGKTIVLVKPGEKLFVPTGLEGGIQPMSNTVESGPAPITVEQMPAPQKAGSGFNLFWLAVLALAILGLILATFGRRFFANPATSGQPIVDGGISTDEPRRVEDRFQQIADRRYAAANPTGSLTVERPVRVSDIEEGTLSGVGRVQYRDRIERRHLNREPAYRATFRFPNGTEETLYFLQACANDVTYSGMRYLGFTFTAGRTVVVPPQPQHPQPTPVVMPVRATATTITVGDIRMTVPEGTAVHVGNGGEIMLAVSSPGGIIISPIAKVKAKRAQKSATPTAAKA